MTTFLTDELPLRPTAERASDSLNAHLSLSPEAQDLLFVQARTANSFTDEPVSDGQLRAVYDLVKWAPTAMNSQPLRIVLVRSSEARERLVSQMSEGNRDKSRRAPLVAVLAADLDFHDELHRTAPHAEGTRERFAGNEDGRRQMALTNATLQAGYFLLGVRAAGLAAGPMGGFRRRRGRARTVPRRTAPGPAGGQHRPSGRRRVPAAPAAAGLRRSHRHRLRAPVRESGSAGAAQPLITAPAATIWGEPISSSSAAPSTTTPDSKVQSPLTVRLDAFLSDGAPSANRCWKALIDLK